VAATEPRLRQEPTGDLVRHLLDSVQTLVDRQVALVKQELREDVQQVAGAAKSLGIGSALLLLAAICFFDFLFHGINTLFPGWGWVAALAFTLIFGIVGAVLAKKGVGEVKVQPLIRTRETLKEDAEWAKHRLTPNGRSSHSATTSPAPSRSSSDAHAA
jgi:hypothetical protein